MKVCNRKSGAILSGLLLAILFAAAPCAHPQDAPSASGGGGGQTGSSSNSTPDPFGTTLADTVTFSNKVIWSNTRDLNLSASANWVFGCIRGDNDPDAQTAIQCAKDDFLHHQTELLLATTDSYEDAWNTTPPQPSVVAQKYMANVDGLKAWELDSAHKRFNGLMLSFGESHDTGQAIISNSTLGGAYFFQQGSLQDDTKKVPAFFLVGGGIERVLVSKYHIVGNQDFTSGYVVVRGSRIFTQKWSGDLTTNFALPFSNFGSNVQATADGKLVYSFPASIAGNSSPKRVTIALTLDAAYSYYGTSPKAAKSNAISPSLGLTFKFNPTVSANALPAVRH